MIGSFGSFCVKQTVEVGLPKGDSVHDTAFDQQKPGQYEPGC